MKSTIIEALLTNLIMKKFYKTLDEAMAKLDVYFAVNRITSEQYAELALVATDVYAEPEPEPIPEEVPVVTETVQ